MCMARIVMVIDDIEKELWVKQAHQEMCSLSEWIRRAGRERAEGKKSYISSRPVMVKVSPEQLTGIEWIPPRTEEYAETAVEASVVPPRPTSAEDGSADSSSPSTAPCRRHKIHHLYHSGRPCPLCNYPKEG